MKKLFTILISALMAFTLLMPISAEESEPSEPIQPNIIKNVNDGEKDEPIETEEVTVEYEDVNIEENETVTNDEGIKSEVKLNSESEQNNEIVGTENGDVTRLENVVFQIYNDDLGLKSIQNCNGWYLQDQEISFEEILNLMMDHFKREHESKLSGFEIEFDHAIYNDKINDSNDGNEVNLGDSIEFIENTYVHIHTKIVRNDDNQAYKEEIKEKLASNFDETIVLSNTLFFNNETLEVNGNKTLIMTVRDFIVSFDETSEASAFITVNEGATLNIETRRTDSDRGCIDLKTTNDINVILNKGELNLDGVILKSTSKSAIVKNESNATLNIGYPTDVDINMPVTLFGESEIENNGTLNITSIVVKNESFIEQYGMNNETEELITYVKLEPVNEDVVYIAGDSNILNNYFHYHLRRYVSFEGYTLTFKNINKTDAWYQYEGQDCFQFIISLHEYSPYLGMKVINGTDTPVMLQWNDLFTKLLTKEEGPYTIEKDDSLHAYDLYHQDLFGDDSPYVGSEAEKTVKKELGQSYIFDTSNAKASFNTWIRVDDNLKVGQAIRYSYKFGGSYGETENVEVSSLDIIVEKIENNKIKFYIAGNEEKALSFDGVGEKIFSFSLNVQGGENKDAKVIYLGISDWKYGEETFSNGGLTNRIYSESQVFDISDVNINYYSNSKENGLAQIKYLDSVEISVEGLPEGKEEADKIRIVNHPNPILIVDNNENDHDDGFYHPYVASSTNDLLQENGRLIKDIEFNRICEDTITIANKQNITFDLQDEEFVSLKGDLLILDGTSLTLKNGTITLDSSASGNVIKLLNGSTLTLDNVTIKHSGSDGSPIYADGSSKVIISSNDNNNVVLVTNDNSTASIELVNGSSLKVDANSYLKAEGSKQFIISNSASTVEFDMNSFLTMSGNPDRDNAVIYSSDGMLGKVSGDIYVGLVNSLTENDSYYIRKQDAQMPIEEVMIGNTETQNSDADSLVNEANKSELSNLVAEENQADIEKMYDTLKKTNDPNATKEIVVKSVPMSTEVAEVEEVDEIIKDLNEDNKVINAVNINALLKVEAQNIMNTKSSVLVKLANTKTPVDLTINVPLNDVDNTKNYQVVRIHDDKIEALETTKEVRDGEVELSFETDAFSTYVVVETDGKLNEDLGEVVNASVVINNFDSGKEYRVGEEVEFSVTTNINDTFDKTITVLPEITGVNLDDEHVELYWYNGTDYQRMPCNEDGTYKFGPSDGFELTNATSRFKVKFLKSGTISPVITLKNKEDNSEVASASLTINVVDLFSADSINIDNVILSKDDIQKIADWVNEYVTCEDSDLKLGSLTNEELTEKVLNGNKVEINVKITFDVSADDDTQSAIEDEAKDGEELMQLFDLSIEIVVDGETVDKIVELPEPISIEIDLDEQGFYKPDTEYVVIRYHEGKAERLETTLKTYFIEFENDKFSTFGLYHHESSQSSGSSSHRPSSKPDKTYDKYDTNKDGVVSCEELLGKYWVWDEGKKACVYSLDSQGIIVNTATK